MRFSLLSAAPSDFSHPDDRLGAKTVIRVQLAHMFERRFRIPVLLHEHVEHLAFVVHGAPQPHALTTDLHVHFVEVPATRWLRPRTTNVAGMAGPNFIAQLIVKRNPPTRRSGSPRAGNDGVCMRSAAKLRPRLRARAAHSAAGRIFYLTTRAGDYATPRFHQIRCGTYSLHRHTSRRFSSRLSPPSHPICRAARPIGLRPSYMLPNPP